MHPPQAAVPAAPADPPSLYDLATLYDRVVRPGPCEAFYRDLARRAGGGTRPAPVLELACGTGRLTVPLARDGHEVVGLDASPAMLEAARAKAAAGDLRVTLVRGDMRSFVLRRSFALVVVSSNSLAHLTTSEDLRACLRRVRGHLAPGGLFAFDIVNPDVAALARSRAEGVRLDLGPNPSSAVEVEEVASYDPVRQVRTARWRVREPVPITGASGVAREMAPLRLRLIFPQELPLLLEAEGLELVARHGDFAGNPLTGESLNQVCLARRRARTNKSARSRVHGHGPNRSGRHVTRQPSEET